MLGGSVAKSRNRSRCSWTNLIFRTTPGLLVRVDPLLGFRPLFVLLATLFLPADTAREDPALLPGRDVFVSLEADDACVDLPPSAGLLALDACTPLADEARRRFAVPALAAFLFSARTNWSLRISYQPETPKRLAICSRSFRVRSFKSTGVINGLYLRTWDCHRSSSGTLRSRSKAVENGTGSEPTPKNLPRDQIVARCLSQLLQPLRL